MAERYDCPRHMRISLAIETHYSCRLTMHPVENTSRSTGLADRKTTPVIAQREPSRTANLRGKALAMQRPEIHTDIRKGWDRHMPLAGAGFTVLMVISAAAFPMPPGGDVSPASQPSWLATHYNAVIAQSYVRALAAVAFIALTAAVAAAIRRVSHERSSLSAGALIGGALTGALLLLAQAISLAAALFAHGGGNPDTVRALGRMQDALLNLSSLPAVLLFAATGLAALGTGLLPRWLTAFTLFGVPFALIDSGSYDGGPLEFVGLLGLVYFLSWGLLVGVRLYLSAAREELIDVSSAGVARASV